jgi:LPS export ABC transporter protein LptC
MWIRTFDRRFLFIPAFCVLASLFAACVNDLESIKKVTFHANDPDEKTSELYLTYTDSGYAKIRVYAKLAESFTKPEEIVKFKDGVKVEFYNENGSLASILTALYGEINEQEGTMMVRDSVQLYNPEKNQRMETEVLYWNRSDSAVYTDKMVMIRTPKALLFGKGIKTKQDFSYYEILKPEGKMDIKEKK